MSHKTEIEAVCKLVRLGGGRAWKLHQVGRLRGDAGLPDVFCVWRGEAFWVEVKVGRDRLRPAQAAFIAALSATGMSVVVGGVEQVATYLGLTMR